MPPDNEELDEVLEAISVLLRDGNLSSSKTADQMTVEDAKDPVKTVQEKATSNEHATLETLPNEIISSIAGMLAISINVPYTVSRPGLETSTDSWNERWKARRDLRRLCMVSKRMASNAQKALFRDILITNANTLILLYRTFLENPELGIYVKRMSLNIDHGRWNQCFPRPIWEEDRSISSDYPIDLSPLLSCAQHGLGEHFPEIVKESWPGCYVIPAEIFFTIQFRVLSHASNLESLDVHVHPFLPLVRTYNQQDMKEQHWEEVGGVLCSLWEEVLPQLSKVKKLQLIGEHTSLDERAGSIAMARQLFSTRVCRLFLKLPNLEQLVWTSYTQGRFHTLPFLTISGIDTESRFKSVRVLKIEDSPCVPRGLSTICSAFPNLESLSIDNGSDFGIYGGGHGDFGSQLMSGNEDSASGTGGRDLIDSLKTLKHLKTLSLDLHYYREISGTFGASGALSLAGLPNLETLEMPLHLFARRVEPEGYYQVVSPERTLPPTLKALKVMACWECALSWWPALYEYWHPPSDHGDAVVELLNLLAVFHDEYFPKLKHICYSEVQMDEWDYGPCDECDCAVHLKSGSADASSLSAAERLLNQKGVTFANHSKLFQCLAK